MENSLALIAKPMVFTTKKIMKDIVKNTLVPYHTSYQTHNDLILIYSTK